MLDPFVILAPLLLLPVVGLLRFVGCGSFTGTDSGGTVGTIGLDVASIDLGPGEKHTFAAQDIGKFSVNVTWSGPNIDQKGVYTAPGSIAAGTAAVTVTATSTDAATKGATASATVHLISGVTVNPPSVSLVPAGHTAFTATVNGAATDNSVDWSPNAPGGQYNAPLTYVVGGPAVTVTAKSSLHSSVPPGTATVTLTSGNTAVFVKADTATQGAWHGVYGKDGYLLAATPDLFSFPAYVVSVAPPPPGTPLNFHSYGDPTLDPRGLQKPPGSAARFSDAWIKTAAADPPLTLKFDFEDYLTHRVAIYFVDWDTANLRKQTIGFTDASQPSVQLVGILPLASFSGGVYMIFDLTGHVVLDVAAAAGSGGNGPVMSGIFFN